MEIRSSKKVLFSRNSTGNKVPIFFLKGILGLPENLVDFQPFQPEIPVKLADFHFFFIFP